MPIRKDTASGLADYAIALGERLAFPARLGDAPTRRLTLPRPRGRSRLPDASLARNPGPLTHEVVRQGSEHTVVGDRLCGEPPCPSSTCVPLSERRTTSGSTAAATRWAEGRRDSGARANHHGIVDVYPYALTTTRPYRGGARRRRRAES